MNESLLNAELTATCNALGYSDGGKYFKEPDCLITLKDLVRYLKHDEDDHSVRRELGNTKVLCTDLLPILNEHSDDKEILDVTLRLLVNLTNPAYLLYREELPQEKESRNHYLELLNHLENYKMEFTDSKIWANLVKILGGILNLDWESRPEEDQLTVERMLILIRNVLYITVSPETEMRTDDDATVHDQILWSLHQSGMEDLLLYISNSENESQFCLHALEIISLMFREQTPEQLASSGISRSVTEKEIDEQELLKIRDKEKSQKIHNVKKFSARHSNFGGTFVVKGFQGISSNDLITHKPLRDSQTISFDKEKTPKRKPKNQCPVKDNDITRRSTLNVRLFLKEFCIEFLETSYNAIMKTVKFNLARAKAEANDETYYLWSMKFFMEFNRRYKFQIDLISETISVQSFHYVQTQIEHYQEMMLTDKKKVQIWGRRLHLALKAYQELLYSLMAMDKVSDASVKESCRIIKSNIFYVTEYRDSIYQMITSYDESKLPKSYLKDAVETTHIFLKMLHSYCSSNLHLVVQKKNKKRHKRGKKKKENQKPEEERIQDQWNEISRSVNDLLQENGELPDDAIPFDSTLPPEIDQKPIAMYNIQKFLRLSQNGNAIALLRASRELWPEGNIFGSNGCLPEDEFFVIREIFFAKMTLPEGYVETEIESANTVEELEEETDVENEELESVRVSEQEFSFKEFVKRFSSNKVVQTYAKLLSNFESNSVFTNHCIVKMFHRIAWDCKMAGMFFQASIFLTFKKILKHPSRHTSPDVKELYKFAKFILSKFFEIAASNHKIFVEILFWKNAREVYEIEEGYGSYHQVKANILWTEEQDEELKNLYEEYKSINEPGKDVVDLIMDHIIDETKTRRQIIAQLKNLEIVSDVRALKNKSIKSRQPKEWTEEEENELRRLFEENKESLDVVGCIFDQMFIKRSKDKIKDKIVELKLVNDRKELRKKRSKNPKSDRKKKKKILSDDEVEENIEESDSSDENSDKDQINTIGISEAYELLKEFCANDHRLSIEWLKDELKSVSGDKYKGDDDDISLVPILEAQHKSMDDDAFKSFLFAFGVRPPKNEQESFWKIPKWLSGKDLDERARVLELSLEDEVDYEKFKSALLRDELKPTMSRAKALEILSDKRKSKKGNSMPKKPLKSSEVETSLKTLNASSSDDDDDDDARIRYLEKTLNDDKNSPNDQIDDEIIGNKKKSVNKELKLDSSSSEDELSFDDLMTGNLHSAEINSNQSDKLPKDKVIPKRARLASSSSDDLSITNFNKRSKKSIEDNLSSDNDETPLEVIQNSEDNSKLSQSRFLSSDDSDSDGEVIEKRKRLKKSKIIESDSE